MDNVIEVNNVSKRFMLLTETRTLFRLFKTVAARRFYHKEIWALKDINFNVKKSEKIAVIGDNASGKTTLLRIISGIYKQTGGTVRVNGEMSTFLQIGIDMQRDLSALENIYLVGAVMGFNRRQIQERLDSIIDFSELRNFIYSPLRDFSTGMIQRLGISIAKEINSEILILDEMLVGGDVGFVEKCYKVFEEYKKSDKALLMSSHSLDTVERFCDKALLLDKGRQIAFGPSKEIIDIYRAHKF